MRRLSLVLLLMCFAPDAWAGTISRCVKSYGGTAFQDGFPLTAAQLNCDLDAIYIEFSGAIDANNLAANSVGASELAANSVTSADIVAGEIVDSDVNASADIDPSKIGDYSVNAGEADNQTSPGVTGTESLATTLEGEIERLRYVINRLAHGAQATGQSWMDSPFIVGNHIANGTFGATDGSGSAAAACTPCVAPGSVGAGGSGVPGGGGWTLVQTPNVAYTASSGTEGEGLAARVTANGAALEGLAYQMTNLKQSARYLVLARVDAVAAGDCRMNTTGAGAGGADLASTDNTTTSYETLAGFFTTGTAAVDTVNLQLLSVADTEACDWDDVQVYEIGANPVKKPQPIFSRSTDSSTGADFYTTAGWTSAGISCTVEIPTSGYTIHVRGMVTAESDFNDAGIMVRLLEGATTVDLGVDGGEAEAVGDARDTYRIPVGYTKLNPQAGTSYAYTMEGRSYGNTLDRNEDDGNLNAETPFTWIECEAIPQ